MKEVRTNNNIFKDLFLRSVENNILILNPAGEVMDINPAFTTCFGYEVADVAGKYFSIFFTEEDRAKSLPEIELQSVLTRGQGSDNNYLLSKDGTKTWVSGESILSDDGAGNMIILKVIQNIHKQKESELALTRAHSFSEDILRTITDVVLVIDAAFEIVKFNTAFLSLFDLNSTQVEKSNFGTLISKFDKDDVLVNAINDALAIGKPLTKLVLDVSLLQAENRMFEVNGNLMETASGQKNLLIVFHDITMFKQLERQKEDIIGFVAHELRNPLSNIGLSNELISMQLNEKKYDEVPGLLQHSKNSVMRLNKMVAELYTATKISSGNILLELSQFNFADMIREAVETTKMIQPSYNIIVEGNEALVLKGDRYKLLEVVNNYLSNGIKYSNGSTDVKLKITKTSNTVVVAVEDNGLGISPDQLPFIFERFFRAEKTRNLEGLGLGLYLCQRIISAHGGRVWAESEPNKGSIFYFSVPLDRH